jgi:hypothetical protein
MLTYTTVLDEVLDLTNLTAEERAHFDRCYVAYRQGMDVIQYRNELVNSPTNPQLRETGGWVSREVWATPLYQAIRDLGDRLAIAQGRLGAAGDWQADPIADEWITASEAAERKGVTRSGLQNAIQRGTVIAHPKKPGSTYLVVSVNTLNRWQPAAYRQENGRKAGAAVAAREA